MATPYIKKNMNTSFIPVEVGHAQQPALAMNPILRLKLLGDPSNLTTKGAVQTSKMASNRSEEEELATQFLAFQNVQRPSRRIEASALL